MKASAKRNRGLTLLEVSLFLFLTGMLVISIALAYQSALRIQAGVLAGLPPAQAAANANTVLSEQMKSASCVLQPSAGAAPGSYLLGLVNRDCDLNTIETGTAGSYFIFCVDAKKRFMFKRTSGAPPAAAGPCAPPREAASWYALSPGDVQASALFRRSKQIPNVINADMSFAQPPSPLVVQWSSTFTVQTALYP